MTEVLIVDDPASGGILVANAMLDLARVKPEAVFGVATGSTPLHVYRALANRARPGTLDHVSCFALDEYVGLPHGHPESYREVIDREVTLSLGLRRNQVHVPDPDPEGLPHAGSDYDRAIREAGGVDLQILGIGTNGHIGFNEPGSSLASRTRVKTLAHSTREDNARFFGSVDDVPLHCITQGIGTILEARHLVLLAFGAAKASAVRAAVEGPITSSAPGSAIQLHPRVTVIVDDAAATDLDRAEYYRSVSRHKPSWQGF